jgi:hypothetical protein
MEGLLLISPLCSRANSVILITRPVLFLPDGPVGSTSHKCYRYSLTLKKFCRHHLFEPYLSIKQTSIDVIALNVNQYDDYASTILLRRSWTFPVIDSAWYLVLTTAKSPEKMELSSLRSGSRLPAHSRLVNQSFWNFWTF